MIEIKNRYNGAVICTVDAESLHGADLCKANLYGADLREVDLSKAYLYGADLTWAHLYGANLYVANLREANLRGANLYGANLYGADMYGANIDGEVLIRDPLVVSGLRYWCLITDGFMRLGCKRYSHAEWAAFTDDQISKMDSGALEFWRHWKEPLLVMCAARAGGETK